MNLIYLLLGLLVLVAFYAIGLYNWLQTTLTRIKASIQDIGNQLKRQASLIPNLEESAKGYLKHEKGIYESLTNARKSVESAVGSGDLNKMSKASDQLSALLPKLQVIVESNPELKSAEVVTRLMEELRDTADKLMYARRVVIDLTADFNMKIVTFPSNLVASMMGFKQQPGLSTPDSGEFLSVSSAETRDPKVSL